jgi:hypothetical protein
MYFFDLAQVMLTFRAFRRDDTPEMANLKADAAISPQTTHNDCFKQESGRLARAAVTAQIAGDS